MSGKRYAEIYFRDAHTCQFCGNRAVTVDHLIPVIAGGTNDSLNLVGACARCNRVKADMRLPNLVNSFCNLLEAGRTRNCGYPLLLWQALLLDYPLEDIPWSQARGRWCRKTVVDVLFNHPDGPKDVISKTEANNVVRRIRRYDPLSSRQLMTGLIKENYIVENGEAYLRSLKTPAPQQPEGLSPPLASERVESAFGLVGEPRAWFTARALKRDIDWSLVQLGIEPLETRKSVWDILVQKRWVFDCDPYFLVDRRKPLKRYVVAAWRQLGKGQ